MLSKTTSFFVASATTVSVFSVFFLVILGCQQTSGEGKPSAKTSEQAREKPRTVSGPDNSERKDYRVRNEDREETVAKIDANRLRVGDVGLPCENGQPVTVTVDKAMPAYGKGTLIVDYRGQQLVLENANSYQAVDGQEIQLDGRWKVVKRHYWNSTLSWYLEKLD